MPKDIYHDELFSEYDKEIKEIFVSDSGSTSYMLSKFKNMENPREVKIVVKSWNKKKVKCLL